MSGDPIPAVSEDQLRALARRAIDAWNDDETALAGLLHADVTLDTPGRFTGVPAHLTGVAGVLEWRRQMQEPWEELRGELGESRCFGSLLVAEVLLQARGRSGIEVDLRGGFHFDVVEDRVRRMRIFETYEQALEAAGDRLPRP